jgi:acyl-coenzyme A synthetase/AMP-(fatty) acid ligase
MINGAALLLDGHDPAGIALEAVGADGSLQRLRRAELRTRVARAAGAWRARGLQPGQPVAVKLSDGIDWVVAWLGALWAGGVGVGVNPRIPADEWRAVRDEAGFALIVADDGPASPDSGQPCTLSLAEARTAWDAAAPIDAVARPPEAPVLWVHSSGSSGRPKAVVHAQRTLQAIGRVSGERLGIGPGDRLLASSRLFFTYALVNVLLGGLRLGATVLLDARWPTAATLAESIGRLRPTLLFSVPALYRNLLHADLGGAARALRLAVSAGEALAPRLREAWCRASGVPLFDGYGSAETLVLVLGAAEGEAAFTPAPGVQVQPLDAAAAAAGEPTRLLIDCETRALGYLNRPEADAQAFRGRAFCPADLFVPANGGWRFAGREDSLVKVRGRWVDLVALEDRLAADVPGLFESAAALVPDADGVGTIAFFYAADDAEAARGCLAARCALLPPHQRPAWLQPLAALPRTATGKLLRRQLAQCLKEAPA